MKKNERLMEQLGEVDDKYIIEAAPETRSKKGRVKWTIIGPLAAAAAGVVLWQGVNNIPDRNAGKKSPESNITSEQPTEEKKNIQSNY